MANVLALGLDPKFVDLTSMPGLTADIVQAYIDLQLTYIRAAGHTVDCCLTDTGETTETALMEFLGRRTYDWVLIGAGLRDAVRRCV